jgi:hypothetical protein
MPSQQGARGDKGGDPLEAFPPEFLGLGGQPATLVVAEPGLLAQLLLQNLNLFLEVFDDALLISVNPTSQTQQTELKHVHLSIMRSRLPRDQRFAAEIWNIPRVPGWMITARFSGVRFRTLRRHPSKHLCPRHGRGLSMQVVRTN